MSKPSHNCWMRLAAGLLALCSLAPLAGAQNVDDPPADGEPIIVDADEFQAILDSLTPEQIDQMLELANERRLGVERRGAIAEIRLGLMCLPEQIDEAVAFLEDNPATTRAESIMRISEAFAIVNVRLAEARQLLEDGDPEAAVALARKILDPSQATYLSAATHLLYGDALRTAGDGETAVEAYRGILVNMPEQLSFAAEAGLRAAETSQEIGRFMHAMKLYAYCLRNYGLTLTAGEFDAVEEQLGNLTEIYQAPLSALAGMMGEVHQQLAEADSGADTQSRQDRIVAILEDIIKTAEEQQGQSSGSPDQQPPESQADQEEQQGQRNAGQADRPTQPMPDSRIVPGRLPEAVRGATVHATDESGDWADLPPRRREQLYEIARRNTSERRRRITTEYHRRLTEEGPR